MEIAGDDGQEAAGVDQAAMVDEHEAATGVDVDRWSRRALWHRAPTEQVGCPSGQGVIQRPRDRLRATGALGDHASMVRCLRGLEGDVVGDVDEPVQDLLDVVGRQ